MRYFKKVDPRIKVGLENGAYVQFEAVTWETGVYPPEGKGISEWLGDQLAQCIDRGVGGITEIQQAEYLQLLELKKNPSLQSRPTREVWEMPHRIEGDTLRPAVPDQTSQPSTPKASVVGANGHSQPLPGNIPFEPPPVPDAPPRPTASKGTPPPP